ncbi:hypothetical protein ACQKP5_15235 [Pseudomonas vancouverensis]
MQAQTLNDGAAEAITNMFSGGKRATLASVVMHPAGASNNEETR